MLVCWGWVGAAVKQNVGVLGWLGAANTQEFVAGRGGEGGLCSSSVPCHCSRQPGLTLTPRMWNSNSARCIFWTAAMKVGALQMTLTSCG